MKETRGTDRQIVEHTSPAWRLIGVVLAFGSVAGFGFWFSEIGWAEEFSTVCVVAAFFAVSWWARRRPDRLQKRFGAFGKIAVAVQESAEDIRNNVYARPLRFGVALGIGYGIAVVAAKSVLVAVLTNLYAWPLAVAVGGAVGALVASPDFFASLWRGLSVQDEDEDEALEEDPEDEDDLSRRRRAAGEE